MKIGLLQQIAAAAGDADGFTPQDRTRIANVWKGKVYGGELTRAFEILGDQVVTEEEFKELTSLVQPRVCSLFPVSKRCVDLTQKIRTIVGRYGRRIRERHFHALLSLVRKTNDVQRQQSLMHKIWLSKPRHEVSLIGPLQRIYRNRRADPRVAWYAMSVYDNIVFAGIRYWRRISYAKQALSLRRSASFMLKCVEENPSCIAFIHPSLGRDFRFMTAAVGPKNVDRAIAHLDRIPISATVALVERIITRDPSRLKMLTRFLLRGDPLRACRIAERALNGDAAQLEHAFRFIRAVDERKAITLGFRAARTSAAAYHFMLPWLHKLPASQSSAVAFALFKTNPHAIELVAPLLFRWNRVEFVAAVRDALINDITLIPHAKKYLPEKEIEEIVVTGLSKSNMRVSQDTFAYIAPILMSISSRPHDKKQNAARTIIANYRCSFFHRTHLMERRAAIMALCDAIRNYYRMGLYERFSNWIGFPKYPRVIVSQIHKTFLAESSVQRALLNESLREIAELTKNHPNIALDKTVRKEHEDLMRRAKHLGITHLSRIHTTRILRELIKNRANVNRVDGRPLALVLFARRDPNEGLRVNHIRPLTKKYRVLYFEVDSIKEFMDIFEKATRAQRASVVYIGSHGLRTQLSFGRRNGRLMINDVPELRRLSDRVAPSGHIILYACLSGSGEGKGADLATAMSDAFPHAFVHAAAKFEDGRRIRLLLTSDGAIKSITSPMTRLTLHAASGTKHLYKDSSVPHLLQPEWGWDNPRRRISLRKYIEHLSRIGYRQGLKLNVVEKDMRIPKVMLDLHIYR